MSLRLHAKNIFEHLKSAQGASETATQLQKWNDFAHHHFCDQDFIEELGGIHVILDAVQRHRQDARVQELGCLALARGSSHHYPDHQIEIAHNGGIPCMLNALRNHPAAQSYALKVLLNLEIDCADGPEFEQGDGIQLVIKVMWEHLDSASVQITGHRVLAAVAKENPVNQFLVAYNNGITAIVNGMHKHLNNAMVQRVGCDLLNHLGYQNDVICETIGREGGIWAIVKAMGRHLNDEIFQELACFTLRDFARIQSNLWAIMNMNGASAITNAMNQYPNNDRVQTCGRSLLALRMQRPG